MIYPAAAINATEARHEQQEMLFSEVKRNAF